MRGLHPSEMFFGEQEGVLLDDAEPFVLSVNQEKGTNGDPEGLEGLSEGSLWTGQSRGQWREDWTVQWPTEKGTHSQIAE